VKGRTLVVQHDVVGAGHAHDVGAARRRQHRQQGVHVVLVGLGMVGVAHVASHRDAQDLAAEVIFEAGPEDLLSIIEVLRADEPDHGVDQQRLERPGDGIGAGLAGLLVHAVVGAGRQRAALPGLEVHHVVPEGAALQPPDRIVRFAEQRQRDAETGVRGLGARDGLKDEVDRRPPTHQLQGGGDVGQHTGLRRHIEAAAQLVHHFDQGANHRRVVRGRVDADDGVAAPIEEPVHDAGRDSPGIIGRVVWLQSGGQPPLEPDGVAEPGDHAALPRHQHQILESHQLRDRCRHFGGEPGSQPGEGL
jgi:hypothetical protein